MDQQTQEKPVSTVPDDTPRNMIAHPLGWKCRTCKKWIAVNRHRVAVTPEGQGVRVDQLIKQGLPVPKNASIVEVSTCTDVPIWQMTPADHWCWQYQPNLEQ
jgi:hypothetical protein